MFDEVEQLVRSRQPDYPPEQSMSGTNTYAKHCEVVGWCPGYCVCLHKLDHYEREGSLKMYPECETGIRNKECQAINMRDMERAAGKSLFYVDRSLLREEMDKRFAEARVAIRKEWGGAASSPSPRRPAPVAKPVAPAVSKPAPVTKADALEQDDGGYAAAINAAIRETQQAPVAEEKPAPKVESPSPVKGRTLLDIARSHIEK